MNVVLTNKAKNYLAKGSYDPASKIFIVKAGSTVSDDIAYSPTFRGAKTVKKLRDLYVKDRTTISDVVFHSPSTAANFVTGRSSNGMILWKTEAGIKLKEALTD